MVDRLLVAQARDGLVNKHGAVVCREAFDADTDVGQEFLRRRGHVGRALAPQGVYPSNARRVILEQD